MEISKREKIVFFAILGVILAGIVLLTFCTPSHAADKDAAYYQRTGTKPPGPGGQFFLPISAQYIEDLGGGIGLGYQWKASGVMLMGQITYDQFNAVNGTTPYQVGCRTYQVPFAVPSYGHRGVEVTVAIPVGKKK